MGPPPIVKGHEIEVRDLWRREGHEMNLPTHSRSAPADTSMSTARPCIERRRTNSRPHTNEHSLDNASSASHRGVPHLGPNRFKYIHGMLASMLHRPACAKLETSPKKQRLHVQDGLGPRQMHPRRLCPVSPPPPPHHTAHLTHCQERPDARFGSPIRYRRWQR